MYNSVASSPTISSGDRVRAQVRRIIGISYLHGQIYLQSDTKKHLLNPIFTRILNDIAPIQLTRDTMDVVDKKVDDFWGSGWRLPNACDELVFGG